MSGSEVLLHRRRFSSSLFSGVYKSFDLDLSPEPQCKLLDGWTFKTSQSRHMSGSEIAQNPWDVFFSYLEPTPFQKSWFSNEWLGFERPSKTMHVLFFSLPRAHTSATRASSKIPFGREMTGLSNSAGSMGMFRFGSVKTSFNFSHDSFPSSLCRDYIPTGCDFLSKASQRTSMGTLDQPISMPWLVLKSY
jgi:hypothetical protein